MAMRIIDFSDINKQVEENAEGFVKSCCEDYDKKCIVLAEKIAAFRKEHPIILLSGPSGSGKTTTALKVEEQLDKMGIETHTVSMDNYFLPKHEIQIFDENNEIDYESPHRIDIPLFKEHLIKLANHEEVDLPYFNFKTQNREGSRKLNRKKDELILFEGIHALNPEVTGKEDVASCIYISVRTRVRLSNGELVHPMLIRLMRRLIRDRNYRNRLPAETLDMFKSVQRGEELYINPFKHRAHFEIDTFNDFEPSVYKPMLEADFEELKTTYKNYAPFSPIEELMKDVTALDSSLLPKDSLSREFIGGSSYKY